MKSTILSLSPPALIMLILWNSSLSHQNKVTHHQQKLFNLLEILRKHFEVCDVYLSTDHHGRSHKDSSVDLMDSIASSSLNSRFLLHLDSYLQQEIKVLNKSCSTESCFQVSTRKYSQCSLVIGLFTQGERKLPVFKQLLISPFKAPTKNEHDHFIFIVGGEATKLGSFMRNAHLSMVKFKLGISIDFTESETLCMFCIAEKSRIVPIPLHQTNIQSVNELFPDFTRNGYGNKLKGSVPLKYPFLHEIVEVDGKWVSKRGVYKFVIEGLAKHFNFSVTVSPSTGHGSGQQFSNGTWNGVIGDVLYGVADFGTSSTPNPARFVLISFTTAMVYPYVSFIVGPPRITYSWKAIYWPFKLHLWFSIIVSLVAVNLIFKLFKNVRRGVNDSILYRHLVAYLSFSLIGQGLEYPNANSSRILLTVWLLAALIFNTLYVSKIVGLLAFPIYQHQPQSFKELVESQFSWGFDKSGGNLFAHFQSSNNPVFHKIFENKEPEKDAVDCFNSATKSDFACVTWGGVANYIAYRNLSLIHGKSPLVFGKEITLFVSCGISFPRLTLHRDNFNNIIGTLRDSGQIDKWVTDDLENLRREKVHCQQKMNMTQDNDSEDDGPDLLSLSNLLGVFYLYIVGHIVSVLFILIELAGKKRDLYLKHFKLVYLTPFRAKE